MRQIIVQPNSIHEWLRGEDRYYYLGLSPNEWYIFHIAEIPHSGELVLTLREIDDTRLTLKKIDAAKAQEDGFDREKINSK